MRLVPILIFSLAAIPAFYETWKDHDDGIAYIFISISVIDFCHGLVCVEKFFFLQFATTYQFYSSTPSYIYDWVTWGLIDTSWAIKLFLYIYKIYRYLKPYANSFSKRASIAVITTCAILVIVETTIVGHYSSTVPWTVPIATFQIMLTILSSIVVTSLIACKPTQDQ